MSVEMHLTDYVIAHALPTFTKNRNTVARQDAYTTYNKIFINNKYRQYVTVLS